MKPLVTGRAIAMLDELRGNYRLQIGTGLIALLIMGWLLLMLSDLRDKKLGELADARQRLEQTKALAKQGVWMERADTAERLQAVLQAEIPPVASPGLAQADFQGWLREIVDAQGSQLRLDVQQPVRLEAPEGVVKLSATIAGGLPPSQVVNMIHRIERRTALATLPVLVIRSDGLNRTFSLTVQAFYRLPAENSAP